MPGLRPELTRTMRGRDIKLDVQCVEKRYGEVQALEPTSLQVSDGEFLTLLGPSGSGKTTLLNLIAGLARCDGGCIRLDGRDITHAAPQHRGLGMVFQNYALFPHMTVAQNLAFGLDVRGMSESQMRKRVAEVLAMVRLTDYAERLPRELSGGQQQRVALARAFAYAPELVLMDEPLGALDRYLREEMKIEIARLHKELGTTVIYVTHDQEEALVLSDRICLMNHARVEQLDTAQNLYFAPQSRFAAEFLGESNLLACRIEPDGRSALLDGLDVRVPLVAGAVPGRRGQVLLRPESVKFGSAAPSSEWRIQGMQFVGAWLRYRLVHRSGLELKALRASAGQEDLTFQMTGTSASVVVDWPAMYFIPEIS